MKTSFTRISLLLALLAFLPVLASALTVTVGPGGPPTYDYANIQDAINAVPDGSTINIAGANYDEHLLIIGRRDLTLAGPASGTPAAVVISATNVVNEGVYIDNSSAIQFANLKIDMTANNGVSWRAGIVATMGAAFTGTNLFVTGGARCINLWKGGNATLSSCTLTKVTRPDDWACGIEIGGDMTTDPASSINADKCLITETNYPVMINPYESGGHPCTKVGIVSFTNSTFSNNHNGQYGITMRFMTAAWEPNAYVLFQDCYFSDWDGYCFHMDSWPDTQTPSSVTFRRVKFSDYAAYNNGAVLFLNYRCPVILENVSIAAYSNEGVYIGYYNRGITMNYSSIANVNDSVIGIREVQLPAPNIVIRDSLLYTPNGFAWQPVATYGATSAAAFDIDWSIANSANVQDFSPNIASVTRGTHYTYNTADPNYCKFTDFAGTGDLHLMAGSPAIGTGTDIGIYVDCEKKIRPYDGGYDMGAYQYNSVLSVKDWSIY
ncbi:MAG: right-handed parallel beta-helix repeat-containing protein [bacterium]|nr:hypothetical protein [Candidatus Sumerlaeota bacterium]